MLRREEGARQLRIQSVMETVRKDTERQNDETLAACHSRYEQLLSASRQECQRLHELNDRLLEQLEERDKMIRSMQKEMAVLIGIHRPGRGLSDPDTPSNGAMNGVRRSSRSGSLAAEEKSALTSTYSTPRSVVGHWPAAGSPAT